MTAWPSPRCLYATKIKTVVKLFFPHIIALRVISNKRSYVYLMLFFPLPLVLVACRPSSDILSPENPSPCIFLFSDSGDMSLEEICSWDETQFCNLHTYTRQEGRISHFRWKQLQGWEPALSLVALLLPSRPQTWMGYLFSSGTMWQRLSHMTETLRCISAPICCDLTTTFKYATKIGHTLALQTLNVFRAPGGNSPGRAVELEGEYYVVSMTYLTNEAPLSAQVTLVHMFRSVPHQGH